MLILMEIGVSYLEITFDDSARVKPPRALFRGTIHYLFLIALGYLASIFIPISKNRVSLSYVLLASGFCGLLFIGIVFLTDYTKKRVLFLESWGKNPFAIYLFHAFLLAFFYLPPWPWWYTSAAPVVTVIQLIIYIAALHSSARFLSRRGVILHI